MPIRQPKGSVAPASSPATRIGVVPSLAASTPLAGEADRAARAVLASPPPMIGWKRSMCSRAAVAVALPVLGHRVEQLGRAR